MLSSNILDISAGIDNEVWFAGSIGASKYQSGTWSHITFENGLHSEYVRRIAQDIDNSIWFGAGDSLSILNNNNWTYLDIGGNSESYFLNDMFFETNSKKWFAHNHGASCYHNDNWTNYSSSNNGLIGDYVLCLTVDDDGTCWFGTSEGVSKFSNKPWDKLHPPMMV